MGVTGFSRWLKETFPDCFIAPARCVDHLLIDANSLVHQCTSNNCHEPMAIRQFLGRLDKFITAYQPAESLVLALDGPAPIAKLETQRLRRMEKAGLQSRVIQSSAVTPGTTFMAQLDSALLQWADARSKSGGPREIWIDPSSSPGEGEIKLFARLARARTAGAVSTPVSSGPSSTCTNVSVLGGDSDLILLALASSSAAGLHHCSEAASSEAALGALGLQVVGDKEKGGQRAFCCKRFGQHLLANPRSQDPHYHHAPASSTSFPSAAAERAVLDSFVLLALLCGNDYLKPLADYDIRPAFAAWQARGSQPLVERNPLRICFQPLAAVLRALLAAEEVTVASEGATVASDATEAPEGQGGNSSRASSDIHMAAGSNRVHACEYARGLLWTLTMYMEAKCPDYYFAFSRSFVPPSCTDLADLADLGSLSLSCPRDERLPPPAHAWALLLLPPSSAKLLLPTLRPLFEPESVLARYFDVERCATCLEYRARLAQIRILRDREKRQKEEKDKRQPQEVNRGDPRVVPETDCRPSANLERVVEERSASQLQGEVNETYRQHLTTHSSMQLTAADVDVIAAAVDALPRKDDILLGWQLQQPVRFRSQCAPRGCAEYEERCGRYDGKGSSDRGGHQQDTKLMQWSGKDDLHGKDLHDGIDRTTMKRDHYHGRDDHLDRRAVRRDADGHIDGRNAWQEPQNPAPLLHSNKVPPQPTSEGLPMSWTVEWSRSRERWYYYNKSTKASSWTRPEP